MQISVENFENVLDCCFMFIVGVLAANLTWNQCLSIFETNGMSVCMGLLFGWSTMHSYLCLVVLE